jgi:hypothetical protein
MKELARRITHGTLVLLTRWVALWDQRETGESLALVRILLPLVIVWDLLEVLRLGLVAPLWAPMDEGGIGPATYAEPVSVFYQWFGASTGNAWWLFVLALVSALCLSVGLFSRLSALILLFAYSQLALLSPDADRGVDTLMRNVMIVLAFSKASATLSVDTYRKHKRWVSDELVTAWPRYLVIAQLVLLYFFAGMLKQASNWSYSSGYSALWLVMEKPHFVKHELPRAWVVPLYPLFQAGTLSTVLWERSAILLPILLWLRATRPRPGKLRAFVNRARLLEVWVATGIFFHLSLALFLALGAFPWGCLALYPALANPNIWRRWAGQARAHWAARAARSGA